MPFHLVESYDNDSERVVKIGGRSFPPACLLEDDDGVRWFLSTDAAFIHAQTWVRASAAGAGALLVPLGEGWGAMTLEAFMEERTEARNGYAMPEKWATFLFEPTYHDLLAAPRFGTLREPAPRGDELQPRASGGFVHLHLHTEYSPLDGMSSTKEVADAIVAQGGSAVAIADHGTCAGHPDFQKTCDKAGIKAIFAMEAYFVDDRLPRPDMLAKNTGESDVDFAARKKAVTAQLTDYSHMVLIAMNDTGLHNLWAMSTESYLDGFYHKPRVDWDTLERLSEGVIATSGCLRGPLTHKALLDGNDELAVQRLSRFLKIFDDRFYIEIHTNHLDEQVEVNKRLVSLATEHSVPMFAAVDSHYAVPDDKEAHRVWLSVQTNSDMADESSLFAGGQDYHIKSEAEVRSDLAYLGADVVEQCIANTAVVADRCDARVQGEITTPIYSKVGGREADADRLFNLCMERWHKTQGKSYTQEEAEQRFEHEFPMIVRKGYPGYFLMVAEQTGWARSQNILVGPGRGSGGGCFVAYLAGITDLDPLDAGIPFERFMTEGRVSLPDFDVDYPRSKKFAVQQHNRDRYGADAVAIVGSVMRLRNKGIIKKLGAAMKSTLPDSFWGDQVAMSAIINDAEADTAGLGLSWTDLWDRAGDDLQPYRAAYPHLFAMADKLVGRVSGYGQHASGLVISPDGDLSGRMPLRRNDETGYPIVQFDKDVVEELGYIKFDLLTIRNLDTIQETIDLIYARRGLIVDVYNWVEEYRDPQVWEEIANAHTLGIFQIETVAGTRMAKRMQPHNMAELADMITLVRPGPMNSGLTDIYLKRRNGEEEVSFPDPRLEQVLAKTYGAILYQEDIITTCMLLAGYNSTEADEIRSLLGKKKVEKVAATGKEFVSRAVELGMTLEDAAALWSQMAEFSKYSFGKAHAYAYAILGFWCVVGPTKLYDWDAKKYVSVAKAFRTGVSTIACYNEETGQTVPGKVKKIIRTTGAKNLDLKMGWVLRTKSNKRLECSEDHKILTPTGYKRLRDLRVGDEIASERRTSTPSPERRQAIADSVREYWATVSDEERGRRISELNAGWTHESRSANTTKMWAEMEPMLREPRIQALIDSATGGTWGSRKQGVVEECGHRYASSNEKVVCDWMNLHGIEHQSQVYVGGGFADFQAKGVFIEFDGIGRPDEYFEKKFGDEALVVIRSIHEIDDALHFLLEEEVLRAGGFVTFEPIVSITQTKPRVMYDVVMEEEPHNFLADGVVVHNCAWFKNHFPVEFLTAALSTVDKERIPEFIKEARRMGLSVLPPDINESGKGFKAGDVAVRYGLDSIKGIAEAGVAAITQGQPYTSWDDYLARKGSAANSGVTATLARIGAFDALVPNRRGLETLLLAEKSGESARCVFKQETISVGPTNLPCVFDWENEPPPVNPRTGKKMKPKPLPKKCTKACRSYTAPPPLRIEDAEPYTAADIRDIEQELLGVFLSSTPFDMLPEADRELCVEQAEAMELKTAPRGLYVIAGVLSKAKPHQDSTGRRMGFLAFETEVSSVDVVCFDKVWGKYKEDLRTGKLYLAEVEKTSRGYSLYSLAPIG